MEMATTVQVSDETKRLLNQLKKKKKKSYDKIIKELVLSQEEIPESLFGKHQDIFWDKSDRMRFKHE